MSAKKREAYFCARLADTGSHVYKQGFRSIKDKNMLQVAAGVVDQLKMAILGQMLQQTEYRIMSALFDYDLAIRILAQLDMDDPKQILADVKKAKKDPEYQPNGPWDIKENG